MKILKYSIITFLILIVAFFAIGIIVPSFTYEIEIEVDAPLERTWKYYVSEDLQSKWMLDLVETKLISGEQLETGAVTEYTFLKNGEKIVVLETLTDYKELRNYGYKFTSEVLVANTNVVFRDIGEGKSAFVSTTEVRPKGLFLKSLFAIINATFSNQAELQYYELKRLVETEG